MYLKKWGKTALTLSLLLATGMSTVAAKEKLLFIPIDDRPVCLSETVNSLKAAGWDVQTPPQEYIASYNRSGDPDQLYAWLEKEAPLATDAVVSSDSLIYGGLVPSRTHELKAEVLEARTKRLLDFKKRFDTLRLYVYATVMRSPRASSAPVEPAYYSKWGPQLFAMGELRDKLEQGKLTKKKEQKHLVELEKAIPEEVQADLYTRRRANLAVTKQLLQGVEANAFDYFLLGRDDTAVYSDAHRDARALSKLTQQLPAWKIRFFAGADQLGLILLNRAVNKIEQRTPLVYTFYQKGKGAQTIPSYEDDQFGVTVKEHILAAGAYPARLPQRADLVLGLYTPEDGVTLSSTDVRNTTKLTKAGTQFVNTLASYVKEGYNVGVADVAFGNGSSNALIQGLFTTELSNAYHMPARAGIGPVVRTQKLAWTLGSYAGWNTASNTLGYALGQGLLRPYLTEKGKNALLSVRYLDEWAYQANARQKVRQSLIWPQHWVDGALKPEQRAQAETAVTKAINTVAQPFFRSEQLQQWQYTLPWSRMFEVDVKAK